MVQIGVYDTGLPFFIRRAIYCYDNYGKSVLPNSKYTLHATVVRRQNVYRCDVAPSQRVSSNPADQQVFLIRIPVRTTAGNRRVLSSAYISLCGSCDNAR